MKLATLNWNEKNPALRKGITETAEKALAIMIKKGLTREANRKAVYLVIWKEGDDEEFFQARIGTTFPDDPFEAACKKYSLEKIIRQMKTGDPCSMASRNPDKDEWGGSISVVIDGVKWYISVSGLKEWEDQALCINIACLLSEGQARIEDFNIQRILEIGENVTFVDFKNITDYTRNAFDIVKTELASAA